MSASQTRRTPLRAALILGAGLCLAVAQAQANSFETGVNAFTEADYHTARTELLPVAQAGDVSAQILLGIIYSEGKGVQKDYTEARKWYRKAAEQGDTFGAFLLGLSYLDTSKAAKHHEKGVNMVRRAAEKGNPVAQRFMANAYKYGWVGLKRDPKKSEYWLSLAETRH